MKLRQINAIIDDRKILSRRPALFLPPISDKLTLIDNKGTEKFTDKLTQ